MNSVISDIKRTLRNIAKAHAFFATVILTLAIGIGANTAIFSIVQTVLLEPLPYPGADRIVGIANYPWIPTEIYLELKNSAGGSFEEVAAYSPQPVAVTGSDRPYELEGALVSANFFRIFHASMSQGRDLSENDAVPGGARVVVIGYQSRQLLASDGGNVAGRSVNVNAHPHEIAGVLEPGFRQITANVDNPQIWIPTKFEPARSDGSPSWVIPLVRLNEGVPIEQAQAELQVIVGRFLERHPEMAQNPRWKNLHFSQVRDELVRNVRSGIVVLQVAVAVVLLIACVNVANLLQARFSARQAELAIRSALGATTARLSRQLLTETVVLFIIGGLAGFALMAVGLKLILALAPAQIPRIDQVTADVSVFVFTLAVSIVTGVIFGVFPATASSRRMPFDLLKQGARSAGSRSQNRLSQALVVAEVTLTLMLLVGAGLLIRSFVLLVGQDPGFRTDSIAAVTVHLPENRYQTIAQLEEFFRLALERIEAIPGVESAAVSNNLPISRSRSGRDIIPEGESDRRMAQYGVVSPNYFKTLDVPILAGRDFQATDRRHAMRVAIVDEAMANGTWPGEQPLGKRFHILDEEGALTVVGVVANTRGGGLDQEPSPGFYISNQQRYDDLAELSVGRRAVFLIHTQMDPNALSNALRQAVWEVDPLQPVPEFAPLDRLVAEGVGPQRFRAALLGTFAAIALVLVLAGIYGVMEYLVVQKTYELGIRKALGATDGRIVADILKWGLRLVAVGVALGLIGMFALNRFLGSLLFGVSGTDTWTLLTAVVSILLVTLAACFIPARRVAAVDPIVALRADIELSREATASR